MNAQHRLCEEVDTPETRIQQLEMDTQNKRTKQCGTSIITSVLDKEYSGSDFQVYASIKAESQYFGHLVQYTYVHLGSS